ncbi:hypothetical protein EYF80_023857 [Liparis tanakae]|uniref:Uncharacterized protein n=1 Tax=Liparis tanakae TaxID=230148 RepID=A0A4Z2HJA1_9TELE|nr:hypothetical protein EYF80_023857 [Liparis tanakae]
MAKPLEWVCQRRVRVGDSFDGHGKGHCAETLDSIILSPRKPPHAVRMEVPSCPVHSRGARDRVYNPAFDPHRPVCCLCHDLGRCLCEH